MSNFWIAYFIHSLFFHKNIAWNKIQTFDFKKYKFIYTTRPSIIVVVVIFSNYTNVSSIRTARAI